MLVIEDRAGLRGNEKINKEFQEKFYYLTLVSAKGVKLSITAVSKSLYEAQQQANKQNLINAHMQSSGKKSKIKKDGPNLGICHDQKLEINKAMSDAMARDKILNRMEEAK